MDNCDLFIDLIDPYPLYCYFYLLLTSVFTFNWFVKGFELLVDSCDSMKMHFLNEVGDFIGGTFDDVNLFGVLHFALY